MKKIILSAFMALAAITTNAQVDTPQPSPLGKISQEVGLTNVQVEYSRPSAKGRTIFGDLVPFGKMWRLGANASTKIEFSEPVTLNGAEVPAGKYALYAIPNENAWEIVIHKNLEHWGVGAYKQEEDQVRFTATPEKTGAFVETFTIGFDKLGLNNGELHLTWENTSVKILIETNTQEKVAAQVDAFENPKPNYRPYYNAASYYYNSNLDNKKALAWINKAVEIKNDAFWVLHLKAKIQLANGLTKEAIETAEKSKAMADKAGNADYVALNNKLIAKAKKG
tara:strand:- start:85368 stop:86210 length:843 start_codon:yes stop_codon:yes gene_type:complete